MKTFLLVFGTRPEAIKLAPVIRELRCREGVRLYIAVSGQHREMLDEVLVRFDIRPDFDLSVMREGQSLALLTSRILLGVDRLLTELSPDVVIVHGDTTTAFASSLAAFYRSVPVAHIEAGLRTHDMQNPFPEDYNRRAIALATRYHFAPTAMARDQLLGEGVERSRVHLVGNTVIDTLGLTVCEDFRHILLDWVSGSRFILVTAHRRENLGLPMQKSLSQFRRVLDAYPSVKAILPMHKNPAVREVVTRVFCGCESIRLVEPLDVFTFHNLLFRSDFVVSDSGGIQEEAAALHKPVLVMRDVTERPEGEVSGGLRTVGTDGEKIARAFRLLMNDEMAYRAMATAENPFGDGHASERIADILTGKGT